jgi:hypothetical protein
MDVPRWQIAPSADNDPPSKSPRRRAWDKSFASIPLCLCGHSAPATCRRTTAAYCHPVAVPIPTAHLRLQLTLPTTQHSRSSISVSSPCRCSKIVQTPIYFCELKLIFSIMSHRSNLYRSFLSGTKRRGTARSPTERVMMNWHQLVEAIVTPLSEANQKLSAYARGIRALPFRLSVLP